MSVKIHKGDVTGLINMTPMIDCVFLLLIFFLVATTFDDEKKAYEEQVKAQQQAELQSRREDERTVKVVLPEASEAVPLVAKPKELVVHIDKAGHFIVNRQTVDAAGLLTILQQASANNPGKQTVIIRTDKKCPFQYFITVVNLCLKANIRDYRPAVADDSP